MKTIKIVHSIAFLLILLFVYAAISKLVDYHVFRMQLHRSPLLAFAAPFVAWFIPVLELFISTLLVFEPTRLKGLYASILLLSLFTFYLIAMLCFSPYIPCSCGGILQGLSWKTHILFNLVFIALCIIAIVKWQDQYNLKTEPNDEIRISSSL